MKIRVIDNFIKDPDIDGIFRLTKTYESELQQSGLLKFTSEFIDKSEDYNRIQKNLNEQIALRLSALGYDVEQHKVGLSLLRINTAESAYKGSLHHDKNSGKNRKLTVILYFNAPAKGGELAFPFYDPAGRRVNNALVDELDTLADKGVFYKNRIQVDKQTAFCVKPQCNRAVIFDTRDHTTWHQGTDVKQGVKMAYVAFFE